jgi:Fur family ferric uptake transcriptional regulator
VLELAQGKVARLGIATVYRNLKALESEGWLAPVSLPGQPVHYERSGLRHHHHFHCRACGKVYDVNDCPGNIKRLAPKGFTVENHELTLYGVCRNCSPAG